MNSDDTPELHALFTERTNGEQELVIGAQDDLDALHESGEWIASTHVAEDVR